MWGGTAGVAPYTMDKDGCGPSYANSLFEDGAEFGAGHSFAYIQRRAKLALEADKILACNCTLPAALKEALAAWRETYEDGESSTKTAPGLQAALEAKDSWADLVCAPSLQYLLDELDMLVKPSV